MESRKMNNSCDTNDAYKADGFDLIQEKLNSSNSFRNSGFQIFRDSGLHSFKDLPAAAFYSSPNIYQNQNKNPYDLINNVNTIYRASNESPSVEEFCILRENRVDENTERKNNQNENENENINNNNIAQAELREPINSNQPVYEKPCDNSNCDNMTDNGSTLCTECFKNDTTGINTIFNCCQQ